MRIILAVLKRFTLLLLPIFYALAAGGLLILAAGANPLTTYTNLFRSGFSCAPGAGRCALVTALTFATPLILSGLSATVALRANFFSLGQVGQMVIGAAAATWMGSRILLPIGVHPIAALVASSIFGGLWALIPALLKEFVGVNEIISTLLLNPIAGFVAGQFPMGRVKTTALLLPLIPSTKLSAGIFIALGAAVLVYVFYWRTTIGLEIRNTAQAPRFAGYGGITSHLPVLYAMILSGALAGLAGAVEVLGVQYRFVTSFSTFTDFDGLIVAFVGHLNPLGVVIIGILLGGLRNGSIAGLQIQSHIPNELGGAIIAFILLFVATNKLLRPFERISSRKPPISKKPSISIPS
jgi:general nucleoside transport system permease protein